MLTRLLLLTLFHLIVSYTVIPDEGYYPNATCLHCHNLQYYLQNSSKYFPSNTQLLFLPGLHHLYTDFIIQNVHNVSIIGFNSTVIHCNSSAGIIIKNITNLLIENMVIKNCLTRRLFLAAVILVECSDVKLQYLQIYQPRSTNGNSLQLHNMMGDLYLNHITCDEGLYFQYNKTNATINNHMIHLEHYNITDNFKKRHAIFIDLRQFSKFLMLKISNNSIKKLKKIFLHVQAECTAKCSSIVFNNCQFNDYKSEDDEVLLHLSNVNVYFINCRFVNHFGYRDYKMILISGDRTVALVISYCIFHDNKVEGLITVPLLFPLSIKIEHSEFYNNMALILLYNRVAGYHCAQMANIAIENTTFSGNKFSHLMRSLFRIICTRLLLTGPVKFYNTNIPKGLLYPEVLTLISIYNSTITVNGYIEFSQNTVNSLILYIHCAKPECFTMNVCDNTTLVITNNTIKRYFMVQYISDYSAEKLSYLPCFFQYLTSSTKSRFTDYLILLSLNKHDYIFSISHNNSINISFELIYSFHNSMKFVKSQDVGLPISHCYWLPHSTFTNANPLNINKKYIKFINNSEYLPQMTTKKLLCYCTNDMHYDCYKDDLGYVYPGQTAVILFCFPDNSTEANNIEVSVDISKTGPHFTPCIVYKPTELIQFVGKKCTSVQYTIVFSNDSWCELFLKLPFKERTSNDVFYVRQFPCPLGFIKKDGICQCYPLFKLFGIINCDVNNQTILRPTNSWLFATSKNSYDISLNCPFHYCISHSFHLNLSTPDMQCQFNRSGVLCGKCQIDLSTIFGSPSCQHCSSVYLLITIPIAIAGIILVLLLFLINITVTDGSINGFILYANIVSINSVTFFPYDQNTFAYVFISLANLDLGIQTCFYNGMDDYAKMWLQLAFPFYLIFIATSLIMASRYSNRIQKITAHRALPVLATLFLLSYTKILRTVSIVLFFYSSVTHLPTKNTKVLWSIDPNIRLFGVKFTSLFVVCAVLFLILVPFNATLLFTKMLSRFRIVTRFKPLLDAYQGPYKIEFYYWPGLQLILRTIFFVLSSLDTKINFTVGFIILIIANIVHAYNQPFKTRHKNSLESLFILNLICLFTSMLSFSQSEISKVIINILIGFAAFKLVLIALYHILIYLCSKTIKKRATSMLHSCYDALARWMNRLYKNPQISDQKFQLCHYNIPEATYHYQEYREPLIGQEYYK